MAQLAAGTVADRPWGQTLGALGARGLSGQLTLMADGKAYVIAFARGAIIAATSPNVADSAVRVALTTNLVSSTQVNDLTRRIAAARDRDELDVIAEAARLTPEQVTRLRRRLVAQCAARTFSIDRGEFFVEDRVSVPVVAGSELDVRAVIFLGARQNLTEARLIGELAQLGVWFQIKPEAVTELAQYGFTETDRPVLSGLLEGATLDELAAALPNIDIRTTRAITYALVTYGACRVQAITPPRTAPLTPPRPSQESDAATVLKRAPTATPPAGVPTRFSQPGTTPPPSTSSTRSPPTSPPLNPPTDRPTLHRAPTSPGIAPPARSTRSSVAPPRAATGSTNPPTNRTRTSASATANPDAMRDTQRLIKEKLTQLDGRVDHFALLGTAFDAPAGLVRTAYFDLARKLHPDRLAAVGITDDARDAQRLFAQINAAFAVLSDVARRAEYVALVHRGGEEAVREEQARADQLAMAVMRAEEAFHRGELALRRDQLQQAIVDFSEAAALQPAEPDYRALLAWAKFAAAPDKNAVAAATRNTLQRAAADAPKSPTARFYLGRVERMLGREKDALAHFKAVLAIKPSHADAASEVRVLEQRLKGK